MEVATRSDSDTDFGGCSGSWGLPQAISGIDPSKITTVIESMVVTGETSRVRSFLLYGRNEADQGQEQDDDENDFMSPQGRRMLRVKVVVCYEEKMVEKGSIQKNETGDFTTSVPSKEQSQMDQLANIL